MYVIWASAQDTCSVHASIYMVNSSPFAISEVKQSHSATRSRSTMAMNIEGTDEAALCVRAYVVARAQGVVL